MALRSLILILFIPALFAAFIACSGDDDDGGATDEPQATDIADDDGDDSGDSGDDDGDDDDGGSSDSRGSGMVVVGDETFEVDVDFCLVEDGSIIIAGTSSTADGQSVYVSVETDPPYGFANADVGIGSTSLFDVERGDVHYESAGYSTDADFIPPYIDDPNLVVETNGEAHISFAEDFFSPDDIDFSAAGTLDLTCE